MERNILKALKEVGFQVADMFRINKMPETFTLKKGEGHTMVHPCVIDGQQTLVFEKGLIANQPEIYRRLQKFAESTHYRLLEDRRADFISGIKRVRNQRRANVITIMALTAGLMSNNVDAKSADVPLNDITAASTQSQVSDMFELDSFVSEEDLVSGLLNWINQHSSFTYDLSDLPVVNKVPAREIATIAFGGELPKAVDVDSLQIYGLYNFNEKAIYILDSLDLNSERGRAILLHELVHFLQYQVGDDKKVECKNELESLAYLMEAKYLQAHDQPHTLNVKQISRLSECR